MTYYLSPKRKRRGSFLATLTGIVLAGSSLFLASGQASAIAIGGGSPFGLSPVSQNPHVAPLSYFNLSVSSGNSSKQILEVGNLGTKTEYLDVTPAYGVTATNSGSSYKASSSCVSAGCWLKNLPKEITLPAKTHEFVPFNVQVPSGTSAAQYLAGITVYPVNSPTEKLKTSGNGTVDAKIVGQATVGVAVTVGSLSSIPFHLVIPTVTATHIATLPRLNLDVVNDGKRFTKGKGNIACKSRGKNYVANIIQDTILPTDQAQVPANMPGLSFDSAAYCVAHIYYGDSQVAIWKGTLFTGKAPSSTVKVGPGRYASVPHSSGFPWWGWLLIGLGILLLAALLAALLRQRRKTREALSAAGVQGSSPEQGQTPPTA